MARKNQGDSLRYTAGDWNRHEDAADDYERRALGEGGGEKHGKLSTGRIRIKNSSGADRRAGEILQVGDYLLTDIERRYPWFDADLHDGTDAPFAVLLEPIIDGEIGLAQIAGVCMALVNFAHASQQFARPDPAGTDVLKGEALGPVRILHKPTGTGELKCLVNLGDGRFEAWGFADDNAAVNVPGTVSVWEGPSGGSDTTVDCEAECISSVGVVATKKVTLALMGNVLFSIPIDECA